MRCNTFLPFVRLHLVHLLWFFFLEFIHKCTFYFIYNLIVTLRYLNLRYLYWKHKKMTFKLEGFWLYIHFFKTFAMNSKMLINLHITIREPILYRWYLVFPFFSHVLCEANSITHESRCRSLGRLFVPWVEGSPALCWVELSKILSRLAKLTELTRLEPLPIDLFVFRPLYTICLT